VWNRDSSRAWQSLNDDERAKLTELIKTHQENSEKNWEKNGKKLLKMLQANSKGAHGTMLPCAEDLGAVPACVPKVLKELGIFGLSVVRWERRWDEGGQPYIPLADYRTLSVCTPAVHDSSTLRAWWEEEADQKQFAAFVGAPALAPVYNPGDARTILRAVAGAASTFRVFQIQDLLHLSARWYAENADDERINVPGTFQDFNWTYRLPAPLAEIAKDETLIAGIQELSKVKPLPKTKPQAQSVDKPAR
jgi:4-alpha-glucanotransferase